ncbi:MAG TPA: hypothetical protein VHR86_05360, partial [Armatimonadota bacterium]|nr:hypothetical protein [Armatimonadota bacterium]
LVDDNLGGDGALRDHRLLVLFEGNWLEQKTLDAIAAWVRAGGTLALSDLGPIANIEGDTHTYQELLGPLAARRGDDSVFIPEAEAPAHILFDIGSAGDDRFLGSGWWNREQGSNTTYRWTQAEASLRAPVNPEKDLLVTVTAEQHVVLDAPVHLRVNGKDAGALQFTGSNATLRVPAALLAGKHSALLTLVTQPWRPSERLKDSKDGRLLGLWVDKITVAQVVPGQKPGTLPGAQPAPGFRVDAARVLRDFSHPVGKGRVVFFPLGKEAGPAYRELIRHLIYADGRPLQPTVDTEFDGIHTAVLESKILFLNPTEKAVTKKVSLRPEEFAGVPGPVPPRCTMSLDLQPHTIVAIQRADGKVLSPTAKGERPLEDLFWWNPNPDIAECKLENGVLHVHTQGDDPFITHSRLFHRDTRQYAALVLQVRTNIPGARLYWTSDTHPQLADACSFGFTLPADGAWHTVNVDLRKAANWDGDLRTLRLDLEGPAGYADFQAIRLERNGKS